MSIITPLLRKPRKLTRLSLTGSVIPYLVSFLPGMQIPTTIALMLLILVLYGHYIGEFIEFMKRTNVLGRISYGFFVFGMIFCFWFIITLFNLSTSPLLNLFLAIAVNFNWQNRIIDKIGQFPYKPIFKDQVQVKQYNKSIGQLSSILQVTTLIVIIIIVVQSFIISNASKVFVSSTLIWVSVIVLVFGHLLVHYLVVDQIEWYPKNGETQFITKTTTTTEITYPQEFSPLKLGRFMENMSKLKHPPSTFFEWLEKSLPQFAKYLSQPRYALFFHQSIYAFSYWGEKVKDHLHLLHLIVMATLRKYNSLGKIPLYNRFAMFEYIGLLYKNQQLTPQWRDLLDHIISHNPDAGQLGWIRGRAWNQTGLDKFVWISYWNGKIFKNSTGYDNLATLIADPSSPPTEEWKSEIWEYAYRVLDRFLGPEGGQIIKGDLEIINAIDFLVKKQSLEQFELARERRKEALANPSNRLVITEKSSETKKRTEEEKRQILENYFEFGPESIADTTDEKIREPLFTKIKRYTPDILIYLGLFLLVVINLYGLQIVMTQIDDSLARLVFAVELAIISILTLSGDLNEGDPKLGTGAQVQKGSEMVHKFNTQIKEYPPWNSQAAWFMFYLFSMMILYPYFLG